MLLDCRFALGLYVLATSLPRAVVACIDQTADFYAVANPYQGGGWEDYVDPGAATATLTRERDGMGLTFTTSGLNKGTYTLWTIIFNDPSKCANQAENPTGQCDAGADMLNMEVASLLRGGGDVVDESGVLSISTWFPKDKPMEQLPGSLGGSLTDTFGAEVQLLLLWHGDPLPLDNNATSLDGLEAQLHDIQGGCGYQRVNGGMDPPPINITLFGGPFEFCPMLQGAVFPAVPEPDNVASNQYQTTSMYTIADPYQGGGFLDLVDMSSASVTRTPEGIGLFFTTQGLPAGTYTLWTIIFNDPSKCANAAGNPVGQCDTGGDMLNQEISTVLRGAGDVVDDSGALAISSWNPRDDPEEHLPGGLWGALMEPFKSEVQLLLLWHGAPLPLGNGTSLDSLEAQLHDMQGGCGYYRVNGGMDPPPIEIELFGGPFEFCPMMQGAVFVATAEPTPAPSMIGGPTPTTEPAPSPTSAATCLSSVVLPAFGMLSIMLHVL